MKKVFTLIALVAFTIGATAQNVHDWNDVHVYKADKTVQTIALSKISKISHVKNDAGTVTDLKIETQDETYQYKLSDVNKVEMPVQVGQYLFSDGTWGDLQEGKVPIAVIFSNATTEADAAQGWTHGYALALHRARNLDTGGFSISWGPNDTDCEYLDNWDSGYPGDGFVTNREGYTETHSIPTDELKNYPAFEAAMKFWLGGENYQTVPEGTSGWFLPATGQVFDIFVNLGGLPSLNQNNVTGGFSYSYPSQNSYNIAWQKNVGSSNDQVAYTLVKNNLNKYLEAAASYAGFEADKSYVGDYDNWWTSTERGASAAFYGYIDNETRGWVQILAHNGQHKQDGKLVRPIIAF